MKQLILIRHAKSDWGNAGLADIDRPLNDRGKHDAPVMAGRLFHKKLLVDAFVTSTAKRAKKTAKIFYSEYKQSTAAWIEQPDLYLAPPEVFVQLIEKLDNRLHTVAMFAHNPGITEFANQLCNAQIDNMPTCSIFAVKIHADTWKEFEDAERSFWFFDYPKKEHS